MGETIVLISHYEYFKEEGDHAYKNLIKRSEEISCGQINIKVGISEQRSEQRLVKFIFHIHKGDVKENDREIECLLRNYCAEEVNQILLFLHGGKGIYFSSVNINICEKDVREFRFGGDELKVTDIEGKDIGYNLEGLFERLLQGGEIDPQKEFFFVYLNELLLPLTPLYLSLQAFWGIAIEKIEGSKVTFVRTGSNPEVRDLTEGKTRKKLKLNSNIDEAYQKLFPNPDAFLLVEEAIYDFYSPLFDMVLSPKDKGTEKGKSKRGILGKSNTEKCEYGDLEKKVYESDTFCELLEKAGKDKDLISAFKTEIGDSWQEIVLTTNSKSGEGWFTIGISDKEFSVTRQEFVGCLREFCAILANTKENKNNWFRKGCSENGYFGYKGQYQELRDRILKEIRFSGDEYKHSKLKKNAEDYKKLKEQLQDIGIEKAMVVIGGIKELVTI